MDERILLAEDDEDMRRFLTKALERAGFDVSSFPDGALAFADLERSPQPAALVTDIVMPAMDGLELARRAALKYPALPIMFVTGFAAVLNNDNVPKHAKVLTKPLRLTEFIGEVKAMLAEAGAARPMTSITPSPEMVERAARAMEPGAFARFDAGYTNRNRWDERAFLNAEKTVKAARRKATAAITAALSCPDGFRLVPVEATPEMIGAWYRCKNGAHLSDEQPPSDTSDYAAYRAILAASPAPSTGNGGWRPIASAPTNERIFVSEDGDAPNDECAIAWLDRIDREFYYAPQGGRLRFRPTHWQPLPSAPSQDAPQPISQDQDRG